MLVVLVNVKDPETDANVKYWSRGFKFVPLQTAWNQVSIKKRKMVHEFLTRSMREGRGFVDWNGYAGSLRQPQSVNRMSNEEELEFKEESSDDQIE